MKRHLSFSQYRSIDLCLLFLMLLVFEGVIIMAAGTWFPGTLYTVSVTAAVTAIVMVRWGAWSALFAAAGGLLLCLLSHGTSRQYAVYCVGNLAGLAALPVMKLMTKRRIRTDAVYAVLFGICVQLLMQAGRAAVAVCLGYSLKDCAGFFTTDSLSVLFTMLILWVARRQDGLLEDQKEYLQRIHEEEKAERGEEEWNGRDSS